MEELRFCYKYPHPSVTTDCVIFGFDGSRLTVLLIERGIEPFKGRWAFPGGFLRMDESAEDGALRELYEETGLRAAYIKQFHTFSDPDRDPRERVITIAYYALVRMEDVRGGDDAARADYTEYIRSSRSVPSHGSHIPVRIDGRNQYVDILGDACIF